MTQRKQITFAAELKPIATSENSQSSLDAMAINSAGPDALSLEKLALENLDSRVSSTDAGNHVGCELSDINTAGTKAAPAESNVAELERRIRLYEAVISNTHDFLYVFDRNHRFLFANEALLRVWGKSANEALGKTCLELGYEPWHAAMHSREIDTVIATRQPIKGEVPFTGTIGRRIYEYIFVPVLDEQGHVEAVAGTTRDVTERRHAEEILRESEERLRKIFEHAGTGIAITDIQGRFVQCNPAYCKTIGYSIEDLQQASLPMLVHEDDRQENLHLVRHLAAGTIPSFEIENRYVKRDGSVVWVHKFVSILRDEGRGTAHLIELVTDITERKNAEVELRSSEQFNRSVMDASADCIKIMDVDGHVMTVNQTSFRLMEIDQTETLIGHHWSTLWPSEAVPDVIQSIHRANQGETTRFTAFRPTVKGTPKWWDVLVSPVRDATGSVVRLLSVSRDITERKNAEEQLRAAQHLAEAANRSKSDFLANMSHEIRTPMTAILGYSDLIASRLSDPDDQQCIETIRSNGRFLLEIINDILDLSKIEADKMELNIERISPEQIIADVVSLLEVRARDKGISLQVLVTDHLPQTIEADPVRLRQILLNLLGNAIKFTDKGFVKLVARADVSMARLHFDIVDTGIGIQKEQLTRLFQPFTQADASVTRSHGGTGLGLAISRRLAVLMGGDLSVVSEFGHGSTFSFYVNTGDLTGVPCVPTRLGTSEPDETQDVLLPTIDCLALVVDDRREVRYLAQHFIEEAGGRVVIAQNGAEAVELLGGPNAPPVEIVVMDISMPVMDGITAAGKLRALGFHQPMIALTANAMQGDREKCIEAGFDDYATKPLNGRLLVETINRLLRSRRQTVDGRL